MNSKNSDTALSGEHPWLPLSNLDISMSSRCPHGDRSARQERGNSDETQKGTVSPGNFNLRWPWDSSETVTGEDALPFRSFPVEDATT